MNTYTTWGFTFKTSVGLHNNKRTDAEGLLAFSTTKLKGFACGCNSDLTIGLAFLTDRIIRQ